MVFSWSPVENWDIDNQRFYTFGIAVTVSKDSEIILQARRTLKELDVDIRLLQTVEYTEEEN